MFKKIIPITVLATLPLTAFAGSANVSGYADITYANDDDMSVFGAVAEIDISNKLSDQVSVRVDTDLTLDSTTSGAIEQAYFAYNPIKEVTVLGGVFNNPIGWEKEDAPDMYQISKGQIWGILDGQTALAGNNIAGVALAGGVGPATITVAALNDIGHKDLEKNSFAAVVNIAAMKGLDLELGYVTQSEAGTAGNVLDVNLTYSIMGATIGLEYLKPDEVYDSAMGITLNYQINKMLGATVMYDKATPTVGNDTTSYAVAVSANLASNLSVAAEYYSTDVSGDDDPAVGLEFIASF